MSSDETQARQITLRAARQAQHAIITTADVYSLKFLANLYD